MKNLIKPMVLVLCLAFALPAWSQIDLIKKARKKTEKKAEEEVDKKIDEGLNRIFGNKKTEGEAELKPAGMQTGSEESPGTGLAGTEDSGVPGTKTASGVLNWARYDFVPGDNIIFEDDLLFEENGEFPSRWDLFRGVVEIAELDGENVIMLRGGQPTIIPYLENSSSDYLPEIFTVELDVYMGGTGGWTELRLFDIKNQGYPEGGQQHSLTIRPEKLAIYGSESDYPGGGLERNRWIHIAVAYTNGKFKAYMDDTRLINIPRLDIDPSGITLYSYHASDENPMYFKNIRIAEGGVKYYDRIMQDGKIVANGIRFETGKASLKPESMGVINEVVELMEKYPDLRFSVEGHTDSDGDEVMNMELSQKRAETVMLRMVELGIPEERLEAKGWGESNPVTGNASPEDKANNRRVEFVKL